MPIDAKAGPAPCQLTVAVSQITLVPNLQPRREMDPDLVERYAEALGDGATFPPVTVFADTDHCASGSPALFLADGFHRLAAHTAAGHVEIQCQVYRGGFLGALRYSLRANESHGKRRGLGDLQRAYEIGVAEELADAADAAAVQAMIGCSRRHAYNLTAEARAKAEAERRRSVRDLSAAGKSADEVASEAGVSPSTVRRILGEEDP